MTKESFFKIGAHTNKPFKPNNKPRSDSENRPSSDNSSHRNNSSPKPQRNHSNDGRKVFSDNKTKHIKKQSPYQNRRNNGSAQNQKPSFRNRNGAPSRPDKNEKLRKYNRQASRYVKNEQKDSKKQQPQEKNVPNTTGAKKQENKKIKHNRIIVRNLVFDVNENHLRKLLSPFGEIVDIHIPQNPDKKGSRGFAFVEFANRNFALKAIKDLNGTNFKGRTIVLDESVSKEKYLESRVNQEENEKNTEQMKKEDQSKVKIESKKIQKIQEEQQSNNDQSDNDDNDEDQENNQENELKIQAKKQNNHKKQKTQKEILEDISSEVFIRNLPISIDEKTLHQFFRRYGQLKFAKVVINKDTGLSKGSGFLKFQDPAKAKQLIEYSRQCQMNLLGKNHNFKVNPAINLELQGTVLKLFPVESRDNIKEKIGGRQEKDKAREQKRKEEEKKKKPIKKVKSLEKLIAYDPNDKRNLKLALLGINKATQDMSQKDQQRFMNHERQKLQKLKNPNNSVSDKRIIFKLLNKDITQQDIKALCNEYLAENSHKLNNLTYCKLMLESLETKKSAGFAFVEFRTHEIAVGFLEWVGEEPTKLMKEPYICEFAIQDSRKMVKLQNRNNKAQNKPSSNRSQKKEKK